MASLIKQDGYYYVQFFSKLNHPQRKRVPLRTRRRRIAESAKAKLEDEYALGIFDPWEIPQEPEPEAEEHVDLTRLGIAVDAYMATCAHLSKHTLRTYRSIFNLFREHIGADRKVSALTPRDVLAFLDSTEANPVTRKKYVHHLGYLFRYLVRLGVLERDVSKLTKLPRLPEQAPKSMTPAEVERLSAFIRTYVEEKQDDGRIPDYRWLADIVDANVYLGLRLGEVVHVRWEHVDLAKGTLAVRNSEEFTTKRGKERVIPIPGPALDVLVRIQEQRSGLPWVFVSHRGKLKLHYLSQWFLKFRRMAGLPDGITFHSTRHTYATWLAERGVPVTVIKEVMGHASITTTERYMKVRPATAQHWVDSVFRCRQP